ncbi:MAG TPA: hypothetical protein VKT53_07435 [Candidatus Acidoferrum sp.]|nr:hypothetical protein [Candidatus Acidoferrum sp.]
MTVRYFALWISLLVAATVAGPQAKKESTQQKTAMLFCKEAAGGSLKPISAKGETLVAPDGQHRVFVQVAASVQPDRSGKQLDCANHTTLLAGAASGEQPHVVFSYSGDEEHGYGNGIQLIDWSAKSNLLVGDLLTWWYNSEGWEHNILVYEPDGSKVRQKSLREIISAAVHKECGVEAQLKGFLTDGRLAVRVLPIDAEEEGPSCVVREAWFAVRLDNFAASPIAANPNVRRYGTFLPGSVK